MKKLLLSLLLLPLFLTSQDYNISAVLAGGMIVKYNGTIHVMDSLITIKTIYQGNESIVDYDIINFRNGQVYVTDGVMTHFYSIQNKKGKRKGRTYTHEMYFTFDERQGIGFMVYYLTLIN